MNSNTPVGVLHRCVSEPVAETEEPDTVPVIVPPASLVQTASSDSGGPVLSAPASLTVPDTAPEPCLHPSPTSNEPENEPPVWLVIDQV